MKDRIQYTLVIQRMTKTTCCVVTNVPGIMSVVNNLTKGRTSRPNRAKRRTHLLLVISTGGDRIFRRVCAGKPKVLLDYHQCLLTNSTTHQPTPTLARALGMSNAATGATATIEGTRELEYIVDLNDNDVLLGRGQPILNYSGNVRFRKLIQERKEQYTSTGKHAVKDQIAREILDAIDARGGRFVRKVDDSERDELLVPDQVLHAWRIVDEPTRLSKVKQALREQMGKEGSGATGQKTKSSRKRSSSEETQPPSMMESTRRQEAFLSDAQLLSYNNKRSRSAEPLPSGYNPGNISLSPFQMNPFPPSILSGGQPPSSLSGFSQQSRVFFPPHAMMNDNPNMPSAGAADMNFPGLSFTERQELQRRLLLQQRLDLQRRQMLDNAILPPWSLETAVQQYLLTQQRLQQQNQLMMQQAQIDGPLSNSDVNGADEDEESEGS